MSVDFDVRGQQVMDFFTGGCIVMDYELFGQKLWFQVDFFKQAYSFLLHKMLINRRESCGLLVDYCDVL